VIHPDIRKILKSLAANILEVHCHSITLTQCGSESPEVIRGRGDMRLLDKESFELQMHVDSGTEPTVRTRLVEFTSQLSGTLIPDSEYYTLQATDYEGVVWVTERFLIKRHGWTPTFITGTFGELKHRRPISTSKAPWVTFFLFDDPGFRYNQYVRTQTIIGDETEDEGFELAAARFEEREVGIRVRRTNLEENPIAITVTFNDGGVNPEGGANLDTGAHSRVELRVLEALRYALFRPVSWSLCEKYRDNVYELILAPRQSHGDYTFHSPMGPHATWAKDFWKLFTAYLRHVVDHPVQGAEHYSPLSSVLRPLITTQTNELVVMALLVTVAVEGVLHLEFPHLGARPPSLLEEIASAKKLVRRLKKVEGPFRTRINNALDNMARLRTSDKLKDLRKRGVISKQMIDAWQSLRNASAHAAMDPQVFNNQRLWHDGYTVAMMLHLILFTAIGYSGRYMDFSASGWPEKEFLTPTEDSVNAETPTNVEATSPPDEAASKGDS
jgi:hypothetical protein